MYMNDVTDGGLAPWTECDISLVKEKSAFLHYRPVDIGSRLLADRPRVRPFIIREFRLPYFIDGHQPTVIGKGAQPCP